MNEDTRRQITTFQIKAQKSLSTAIYLSSNTDDWEAFANRLFYASFQILTAYFLSQGKQFKSHDKLRSSFNLEAHANQNLLKHAATYNQLSNRRKEADYGGFYVFEENEIVEYIEPTSELINDLSTLIDQSTKA